MADYNGVNYQLGQNSPSEKTSPGEIGGKVKCLRETFVLTDGASAGLNVNDEIHGPKLPKHARVIDASCIISKSLGATGIFTVGFKASLDEDGATLAEDPNAFILSADGGGQAVLAKPAAGAAGIDRKFGAQETQVFAICTEVMDDAVIDAEMTMLVFYVLD